MKVIAYFYVFGLCLAVLSARADVMDASYTPTTPGNVGGVVRSDLSDAQTFTLQNTGQLSEVGVDLWELSSPPTQSLSLQIRTTAGGVPSEANSGPTVLASETINPSDVTSTAAFVTVSLPDIAVTAGEQLAIVLSTTDVNGYVWDSDLNWPYFGYNAGTYTGGQAYWEGPSASGSNGKGGYTLGSSTWESLFLYNSASVPTGGGPNADYGFETFEASPVAAPEPAGWMLLLTILAAVGIGRQRLRDVVRKPR